MQERPEDAANNWLIPLFDENTFVEIGAQMEHNNAPVKLVCGYGLVQGAPVYAFAQEGAVDSAFAKKMRKIYSLAQKNGSPLVGIYNSPGLDLSEGPESMDTFSELLAIQNQLSGVVPQISIIAGPCIGTNAMLACSADYLIMTKQGTLFATPPTADVPEEAASAENAAKAGVAQIVTDDEADALLAVQKLLSMLPLNNLSALPQTVFDPTSGDAAALTEAAKTIADADAAKIVEAFADTASTIELFTGFGEGVYGALGTLEGSPCGIVATKGKPLSAEDCVKIARLVSVWDSFRIPVITVLNTPGMLSQTAAATRDMAKIAHVYAESTVPKIALLTGACYGACYVALASHWMADYSVAWPSASVGALPPATAVAFLEGGKITAEKPREVLEKEYVEKMASAQNVAKIGILDAVIAPVATRETLVNMLRLLASKRVHNNPKKHSNIPF